MIALTIEVKSISFFEIFFEPGDKTLYNFFVTRETQEDFLLFPGKKSTFIFPQRLNIFQIREIIKSESPDECNICKEIAKKYNCSIHTVYQVSKAMHHVILEE